MELLDPSAWREVLRSPATGAVAERGRQPGPRASGAGPGRPPGWRS